MGIASQVRMGEHSRLEFDLKLTSVGDGVAVAQEHRGEAKNSEQRRSHQCMELKHRIVVVPLGTVREEVVLESAVTKITNRTTTLLLPSKKSGRIRSCDAKIEERDDFSMFCVGRVCFVVDNLVAVEAVGCSLQPVSPCSQILFEWWLLLERTGNVL